MTKLKQKLNKLKKLKQTYSLEEFLLLEDFINSIVNEIDEVLSTIEDKSIYKDDVYAAIDKIFMMNIMFNSNGKLFTNDIRAFNYAIRKLDGFSQTLYKHYNNSDKHIRDNYVISFSKGK